MTPTSTSVPKLFDVEVTYRLVVLASSQQEAEQRAHYIAHYESDDEPAAIMASEIKSEADLPAPWSKWCIPWGGPNPDSHDIGQILGLTPAP